MSKENQLKYDRVFHYFKEISKIPRGSGNSKAISDYLVAFASFRNLKYVRDKFNNVIIYKNGTKNNKNSRSVMLQAHMDMVCEKTNDSAHDFLKDGIEVVVDSHYIRAKDTSLGADDGIGMAYILALLESDEFKHPPLEAVFTSDEEIGLIGAAEIDSQYLHSKYLINLDSEKEGIFYVGCAGAMGGTTEIAVSYEIVAGTEWKIELTGLLGGHSGIDVNKDRGNAAILMGRFLFELREEIDFWLLSFKSGENNNAIPARAEANIVICPEDEKILTQKIEWYLSELTKEYLGCEERIYFTGEQKGIGNKTVVCKKDRERMLNFLLLYPNGVYKRCGYLDNVVETSCTLVTAELDGESFCIFTSIRSSLEAAKEFLWKKVIQLSELVGGTTNYIRGYPAWEYKENSKIKKLMVDTYKEMYEKNPEVRVLHAGLKCSFFLEKKPDLECISIGPDIFDIHTPNEHVSIESVKRVWRYLLRVLEQMDAFD